MKTRVPNKVRINPPSGVLNVTATINSRGGKEEEKEFVGASLDEMVRIIHRQHEQWSSLVLVVTRAK
jgi:hypothetical protein